MRMPRLISARLLTGELICQLPVVEIPKLPLSCRGVRGRIEAAFALSPYDISLVDLPGLLRRGRGN